MSKLGRDELQNLLQAAEDLFPHGECNNCECFLGYIAQLRVDSDSESRDLFISYKIDRASIHHCLGCAPCPPGDLYAKYMKRKATHNVPSPILGEG